MDDAIESLLTNKPFYDPNALELLNMHRRRELCESFAPESEGIRSDPAIANAHILPCFHVLFLQHCAV